MTNHSPHIHTGPRIKVEGRSEFDDIIQAHRMKGSQTDSSSSPGQSEFDTILQSYRSARNLTDRQRVFNIRSKPLHASRVTKLQSRASSRPSLPSRPVSVPQISTPQPNLRLAPASPRTFNAIQHGINSIIGPKSGLRRLESSPESSLIVAIDSQCTNQDFPEAARSSFSVYFSDFTPHLNKSGLLPPTSSQTPDYGILYATMKALDQVHELIIGGEDLSHLIIKTDSDYLHCHLTDTVYKWARNGYRNHQGKPVANARMFKYLHEKLGLLEERYQIKVSFCRTTRAMNEQAAGLARSGLEDQWARNDGGGGSSW